MSVLHRMFRVETAWGVVVLVFVISVSLVIGFQFRDRVIQVRLTPRRMRLGLKQQRIYPQGPIKVMIGPSRAVTSQNLLAAVSSIEAAQRNVSLSEAMPEPLRMDPPEPDVLDGLTFPARAAQELMKDPHR